MQTWDGAVGIALEAVAAGFVVERFVRVGFDG